MTGPDAGGRGSQEPSATGAAEERLSPALTHPGARNGATDGHPRHRDRLRHLLPQITVLAVAVLCLHIGGVEWTAVASFTAYLVLGLVVPGTLLWRALGPTLRWRGEEYALGAAVGYAGEAAGRILLSAAGVPSASPAVPLAVLALFVAVPGLRRHWRSTVAVMPVRVSWTYAGMVAGLFFWLVPSFFASQKLTWPDGRQPGPDLTFLLALAGELSHHWPAQFPYVLGEPLQYHWFYPEHLAAAHTATGIALPVLLFRLALLPMIAVLVVATGALATRLSGRAWAGPLGAFLAWVVTDLTLQRFSETATTYGSPVGSLMGAILWWSPTQTYSAVLFVAASLLVVDVLRRRAGAGHWLLLALLLVVSVGAKASALPVLIVGVAAAAGIGLLGVVRRRSSWRGQLPALGLLALLMGIFLPAIALLYGGQPNGIILRPFGVADASMLAASFAGRWNVSPGPILEQVITGLTLVCFATPWLGALLLARRATRADPAVWLAVGAGALGTAATVLMYHPGQSQLDFIRSALPLLAAAGAWGIAEGLAGLRDPVRVCVLAVGAGLAVCALLAWRVGTAYSPPPTGLTVPQVLLPYLLLIATLGAITIGWLRLSTQPAQQRRIVGAITVFALLFAGAGATRMVSQLVATSADTFRLKPLRGEPAGPEQQAALWLREHSSAQDVFATNVQCLNHVTPADPGCSNLAFWVSAHSERRSLVNGWGYTATAARLSADRPADSGYFDTVPFWDTSRLQRNMALFAAPTRAAAASLRADYGVTWVYADSTYGAVSPELPQVLTLRYRNGPVSIYQVP